MCAISHRTNLLSILFLSINIALFAYPNAIFSAEINSQTAPWFTGPLLELTPVRLAPLQSAIEPVIIISNIYGKYNSGGKVDKINNITSINPIMEFKIGLFPKTELKVIVSYISQSQNHKETSHFQDTLLYFGYQLLKDIKNSSIPDLSLYLQLTIPNGKYDKLNPEMTEIDASGGGAYEFGPALSYRKIFYLPNSFFVVYGNIIYLLSSRANSRDFSVYGGGFGTKGKIRPGQQLFFIISGEYIFHQNWGFVCDLQFFYQKKTSHFKGDLGIDANGLPNLVGLPSSYQISLTPSIEYNYSANLGFFGGMWFSAYGKNSVAFTGGFAAFYYVF